MTDNQDVGDLEIFDVKTSVEPIEYDQKHVENENEDSQDDRLKGGYGQRMTKK